MSNFVAIILGIIAGATEFIPVSSSGHLIIVREILGENNLGGLAFDAVLQLAACFALIVYFWRDLSTLLLTAYSFVTKGNVEEKNKTLLYSIIIGTIPAIIIGLLLESRMETVFRNVHLVALTLILGSLLFWIAEKFAKQNKTLSLGRGLVVGFFQCLALIPGVSRSGATISGGLLAGLTKEEAIRFSFILSIPILLGAGLRKLFEVKDTLFTGDMGSALLIGSLTSFLIGLFSINFLIKYLKNHNLNLFIWYRIGLSVAIFFIF